MSSSMLYVLVGSVCIVAFGIERFNTPPTNRSSTTAHRYYLAATAYVAFGLVAYAFLVRFPTLLGQAFPSLQGALGNSPELVAAVALTVLLPRVAFLSNLDESFRKRLQVMASIPAEARQLAAELRKARLVIAGDWFRRVESELFENGFHAGELQSWDERSLGFLWAKITALRLNLEDWETDRRYSRFVARFEKEFRQLKERYDELAPRAAKRIRMASADVELANDLYGEAIREYVNDFRTRCRRLFADICEFSSRGLLQCELRYGARVERLSFLGFQVQLVPRSLNLNHYVALFTAFLAIFVVAFTVASPGQGLAIDEMLQRSVMIAAIYAGSVYCALVPKERRRRLEGSLTVRDRPYATYVASALAAVVLGQAISLGSRLVLLMNVAKAWDDFNRGLPWALMSAATAFVAAWAMDDRPSEVMSRGRLRLLETLGVAFVEILISVLVHGWLVQRALGHVPPLAFIAAISGFIGGVIGCLVPTWYREAQRPAREPGRIRRVDPSGGESAIEAAA